MADMSIRGTQPQPAPSRTQAAETLRAAGGATDIVKAGAEAIKQAGRTAKPAGDTVAPTPKAPKAATTWTLQEKLMAVAVPPLGVVIGLRKAEAARRQAEGAKAVGKLAEGAGKAVRGGGIEDIAKQIGKSVKRPAADSVSGKIGKAIAEKGAEAIAQAGRSTKRSPEMKLAGEGLAKAGKAVLKSGQEGKPVHGQTAPAPARKPKSPNND